MMALRALAGLLSLRGGGLDMGGGGGHPWTLVAGVCFHKNREFAQTEIPAPTKHPYWKWAVAKSDGSFGMELLALPQHGVNCFISVEARLGERSYASTSRSTWSPDATQVAAYVTSYYQGPVELISDINQYDAGIVDVTLTDAEPQMSSDIWTGFHEHVEFRITRAGIAIGSYTDYFLVWCRSSQTEFHSDFVTVLG